MNIHISNHELHKLKKRVSELEKVQTEPLNIQTLDLNETEAEETAQEAIELFNQE